jgi:hypothetical protein
MTGHGDPTYTILNTDRFVGTNASFTASRTWTLPAANTVNAGQALLVAEFQGTVTGSNTLVATVATSGSASDLSAGMLAIARGGTNQGTAGIS